MRARGWGGNYHEIDPIKANEAIMDGFRVMLCRRLGSPGGYLHHRDRQHQHPPEHMEQMKDGAILANAGHFDVEISSRISIPWL